MRHLLIASFVVWSSLWLGAACATPTQGLLRLEVGMTEDQVIDEFGHPDAVRLGGLRTQAQQPVEIWEYHLYDRAGDRGLSALFACGRANTNYWLYFEEGLLYRWGPAGEKKPPLTVK